MRASRRFGDVAHWLPGIGRRPALVPSTAVLVAATRCQTLARGGDYIVKKLLAVAAIATAAVLLLRRQRSAKAEADLWREATAPES